MGDLALAWLVAHVAGLVCVLLAVFGIARRLQRLYHLNQLVLPQPEVPEDRDYLRSVTRSTYLRLAAKIALLLGACNDLVGVIDAHLGWGVTVGVALVLMGMETVNVNAVRRRLARTAALRRRAQQPPIRGAP